jgi:hypothetical protein
MHDLRTICAALAAFKGNIYQKRVYTRIVPQYTPPLQKYINLKGLPNKKFSWHCPFKFCIFLLNIRGQRFSLLVHFPPKPNFSSQGRKFSLNNIISKPACFFTVFYSSSDASLADFFCCFCKIHSQISWPRSGDCGGAGFEPGTTASSVWCLPVALANWATTSHVHVHITSFIKVEIVGSKFNSVGIF